MIRVLIPDQNNGRVSRGRHRIPLGSGVSGPSLTLSASSIAENSAQGTTIATLTPTNASNPGAVSIASQEVANLFQMNVDGVTLEVGSGAAGLNYEVRTSATVTLQYTDDSGVHQFIRSISITDVADGPTVTGAASSLAAELAGLTVDVETTFDLRDVVGAHPLGQAQTFAVNFGAIDGDGFTWRWTPTYADFLTYGNGAVDFILTVTDADLQELEVTEDGLSITDVNEEPQYAATSLVFEVPEGSAPQIASAVPPDDATGIGVAIDPSVTFDRHILLGATGNFTNYNVTAAASNEVFDLATEVGSSPGQVEKTAVDTVTMHMTADFANSTEYATQFSAGAVTNLGGIPVAALTNTTTLSFTTSAGADVTAPILTSPIGTKTGASTADGGVTTDEDNGTLYIFTSTSATPPSASTLKAGTGAAFSANQAISTTGAKTFSVTGLAESTGYYNHYLHEDAATNQSTIVTSGLFTTDDATAPTLSSPVDAASGSTAATGSVSTNEGNGTLYWVVSTSGTAPTAAQVKLGQDHTGSAAADSGSQSVSGTGVQALSPAPSGLTASTAYTIHFMHEDAATNQSTVASGDGFTTAASGGITEVGRAQTTGNINVIGDPDISGISMLDDDVIIIFISASSAADRNPSATGYTVLADIRANDGYDAHTWVGYLRVSGTPPTSVPLAWGTTSSASAAIATAVVLRGVHTTTLEDVTQINNSGPNTALVSPGSITPSTVGAWIMTFATSAHNLGGSIVHTVTGGEYDTFNTYGLNSSGEDVTTSIAIKEWASGAFAPTAWGFSGTDAVTFSRGVITIAVKPA